MAMGSDSTMWVEKYRPTCLQDLVSHADIIQTIRKFIHENALPHLLFYGNPGTGKTSTILACAAELYGSSYKSMILELNASDERGIDVVRDQIKTFASSKTLFGQGFKLIILDEADNLTQVAQNALRRVIEKYTKNVRFCLICNYVGKIIPALQSRCTRFRFAPLKPEQVNSRLDHVIMSEGVVVTPDGKEALLKLCNGDMRRVLNILQSTFASYGTVTEEAVYKCTGTLCSYIGAPRPADISKICSWLLESDYTSAYSNISTLQTNMGLALTDIISGVYAHISALHLPNLTRIYLFDKMAEIEYNLATSCSERIQLGALIGAFGIGLALGAK